MKRKIPDKEDWKGSEKDLDVKYFHRLVFGKGIDDVVDLFSGLRSIVRADELLFSPRRVFQYYIFSYMTLLNVRFSSRSAAPSEN